MNPLWLCLIIPLLLLVLYLGFGVVFFHKFFKRKKGPHHFKDDLSAQYDFSPDPDYLSAAYTTPFVTVPDTEGSTKYQLKVYPGSHIYLLFLHGLYGSFLSHSRMTRRLGEALHANLVMMVLRGDKESDEDHTSIGIRESEDLLKTIAYLKTQDPLAIFLLYGVSMGGATVIFASRDYDSSVKGVLADSGFSSLQEEFRDLFRARLGFLTSFFLFPVRLVYRLYFHRSMKAYSDQYLYKTPVKFFFVHGEDDHFVPVKNLTHHLEVYNPALPQQSWLVPHCPHAIGDFVDPEAFFNRAFLFFSACLADSSAVSH